MKKEEIIALGVDVEIAQKIVDMASEEIKGAYVPKTRFDEVNEAKKNAEALVKERDGQLEALKESAGDSEKLKQQIADLQEANKNAAKEYESNIKQMKIDNAVEKAILDANGKNSIAIKALMADFLKDAKLSEDGTVKGLSDKLDALSKAEDSSFLFGSSVPDIKGFNPANNAGGAQGQEVDVSKMNYEQLCEYMASNPDAKIS